MTITKANQIIVAAGWTPTGVARAIGAPIESLSRNTNGHRSTPWIQEAVAQLLGHDPEELWGQTYWQKVQARQRIAG